MFSWERFRHTRPNSAPQEGYFPPVPVVSQRGREVEVHLACPMQLAGAGNDIHAVRGELLQEGSIGLTLCVSEDGTFENATLRFWPTIQRFRILFLPWTSIFSLAGHDEETGR